jgi:5'-phosphate synthase pdxT subunit
MDITARRNAYGRQLGSFLTAADFAGIQNVPMTFIRAPFIESAGEGVDVLARTGGHIVAARQGNLLVTAFHPELGNDATVHRYFIDNVINS